MFRIRKRFPFDAAHQLNGLPDGHKCARLHGHTYHVEIVVEAETLDDVGFVCDFSDFDVAKVYVATTLDHRCLNDVLDQPTSEHLAMHLCTWARENLKLRDGARVYLVRVSETEGTWAEYQPTLTATRPVVTFNGNRDHPETVDAAVRAVQAEDTFG